MKKIIFIIILILCLIFVFFAFRSNSKSYYFDGVVYDCKTNELIPDANVQIIQGGGISDIVKFNFDTAHIYKGLSDKSGKFSIEYPGNEGYLFLPSNAGLVNVSKDGYLSAGGSYIGGKVKIGLLKKKEGWTARDSDSTLLCKELSECVKKEIINGVTVATTICSTTLPQI